MPVKCARQVGRRINPETGKRDDDNKTIPIKQQFELRTDNKAGTITTVPKDNYIIYQNGYRKLTPTECERLQNLPDGYTAHVSNTQRYKMLGNGWELGAVKHVLAHLLGLV